MIYKITVRRKTRDIRVVYCMTIGAIKVALRELSEEYPKCFFVLQGIHTCSQQ